MRTLPLAFVLLAFVPLAALLPASVGARTPGAAPAGLVVPVDEPIATMSAAAFPDEQYALYLPPGYAGTQRWPLLIVLDPRGRALPSLERALEGARRNGWVVMSARGSRSDAPQAATLRALQALLVDAQQRFAIDPRRLYLAGMSGTAKSLWPVAAHLPGRVAGIVGCAGAPTAREAALRPAPAFYGCSGTRDFNHASMRALDDALARGGGPHRLDVFPGPHGWPPDLGDAIDWLQLQAMRDGLVPRDAARIATMRALADTRIAAAGTPLARWRAVEQAARDFEGLADTSTWVTQREAGRRDPAVAVALAAERRLLDDERRYQRVVDAWFERMTPAQSDGERRPPPTREESLRLLQVARLRRLAEDPDPARVDSAWRRLALARGAANAYAPARARAAGDEALARAAESVAAAIGPIDPGD